MWCNVLARICLAGWLSSAGTEPGSGFAGDKFDFEGVVTWLMLFWGEWESFTCMYVVLGILHSGSVSRCLSWVRLGQVICIACYVLFLLFWFLRSGVILHVSTRQLDSR